MLHYFSDRHSFPVSGDYKGGRSNFTPGLPQYESDSEQSTTYATLSEGRLNIGGKATTTAELGIHSDAATAHQRLSELPDIQQVLQKQQTVAAATADITAAVRTFSGNMAKEKQQEKAQAEKAYEDRLKEQNDGSYERFIAQDANSRHLQMLANDSAYAAADSASREWGIGGSNSRLLNAATTLITGTLGGQTDLQVAANTLAPYASAGIGRSVGHGENKNEVAQAVGHFVLGATLAYINGGDPLSGGGAAVAAEATAQYLARQYDDGKTARDPISGEFNPNLLPESVKEEIRATTGAIAALVGATGDGGAALNAQIAGVIGQNAVENNYLYGGKAFAEEFSCRNKSAAECKDIKLGYKEGDLKAAAVITPIADEVARFFLTPYDMGRGLAEAKTGDEAVTAIVLALPPVKIFDKARDLVRLGRNLDALKELQRLKNAFSNNPSLATANGIEVPGIAMAAKQHGGGSAGKKVEQAVVELQRGRTNQWNKLASNPDANSVYRFDNGFQYATDAQKRVKEVTADLKIDPWDRNTYQQRTSGGACRKDGDCGGHLIASMFGGPGEGINLVPMDAKLNGTSGKWYQLEQQWKKTLEAGGRVQVKIEPIYSGTSKRPDSFIIQQTLNGKKSIQRIKNTETGN